MSSQSTPSTPSFLLPPRPPNIRNPNSIDPTATSNPTVLSLLLQAQTLSSSKKYPEAETLLTQALEIEPSCADAYRRRGLVRCRLGQGVARLRLGSPSWVKGMSDFDRALELNSDFARCVMNRGVVYSEVGEFQTSLEFYDKSIQMDPNFPVAFYNRANNYRKMGETELALADFTKAIELDPTYSSAFHNRGNVFLRKGDLEAALRDYNTALELYPGVRNAALARITALTRLGRDREALEAANYAVKYYPSNGMDSHFPHLTLLLLAKAAARRAVLYGKLLMYEEAYFEFERARALGSSSVIGKTHVGVLETLKTALRMPTLEWLRLWFQDIDEMCSLLRESNQFSGFAAAQKLPVYRRKYEVCRQEKSAFDGIMTLKKLLSGQEGTSFRRELLDYGHCCLMGKYLIDIRSAKGFVEFIRSHADPKDVVFAVLVDSFACWHPTLRPVAERHGSIPSAEKKDSEDEDEEEGEGEASSPRYYFLRVDVKLEQGFPVLLHSGAVLCPALLVYRGGVRLEDMTTELMSMDELDAIVMKFKRIS